MAALQLGTQTRISHTHALPTLAHVVRARVSVAAAPCRKTFQEMGFTVYGGENAPYVWVGFPGGWGGSRHE